MPGAVIVSDDLTPAARRFLARLVAWAEGYEEERNHRLASYWTEERREAASRKAQAYWTLERRKAASLAPPPPRKQILRVSPVLPTSTVVWRAPSNRSCYHLKRNCPAIPAHGNMKKGKLGAALASGRRLCYYESFHWKKGGA